MSRVIVGTGAALSFLGTWTVMMAAMMLPSLMPVLLRYRRSLPDVGGARAGALTAVVGMGYFSLWTVAGMPVWTVGAALAAVEEWYPVLARGVPLASGVIVALGGVVQLSRRKVHHLACWRTLCAPAGAASPSTRSAWRYGFHLAVRCGYCCGNLMAVLIVLGMMDLRAMAAVTFAITAERLAPSGAWMARAIGAVVLGVGVVLVVRAGGVG